MRSEFVRLATIAVMTAGFNLTPLLAQDREVEGPVPTRSDANNPDTQVYRASDVINLPVKDADGAEVGRIKDLVINGESREVLYAVVAMNDAKQKDALYVMPWTVFQPTYGQRNSIQYTVMGLPQSVWSQAPFYSPAQWQQASFAQWGPRVNNFYAQHIPATGNGVLPGTSVKVNKPVLSNDNLKAPVAPKPKPNLPAKSGDKPVESEKPLAKPPVKPAPEPANPASGANQVDPPKAKAPKLPAPKDPDPADPKVPSPAPREPKVPAPRK